VNKRAFFTDLGYHPHPGQVAIHRSIAPRRIVACGTRWGKTTASAMEGLAAAMAPAERSIGWVVAPTYDLCDRVFREIELIAVRSLKHHIVSVRESDRRLVLRNMGGGYSEIRAKSADNPVSLLGEGLNWLIVDEAARLKPAIWESHLSQRLIDKHGWALLISTPRGKSWFYELYRRGQGEDRHYQSWNSPSWANPLLDAVAIEAERGRLPERVFAQEYGAAFVEGSGAVFRKVRERATAAWQEPKDSERYWAGLDLAKIEDYTVVVIVDADARVVAVDRFHRVDWSVQVQRIHALGERYRAPILVDSTGAGEPVFEALRQAGCNVEPYPFTMKSKSALIDNLALMFEHGTITLPKAELWPVGIEELEAFEYSVTENGHVRSGAPSGAHDDCVIATALAAWQRRADARHAYTGPIWLTDDDDSDEDRESLTAGFPGPHAPLGRGRSY
jgi:hypothetical protein